MSKQVDDLKRSRYSFEYDLDELLDYVEVLEDRVDDLEKEKAELQNTIENLEETVEDLEKELRMV